MHYLLEEELIQTLIKDTLSQTEENKTDLVQIVNKSYENSQKYL